METHGVDLNYRPESYWSPEGLLLAPVANIKGSIRKTLVKTGLPFNDAKLNMALIETELPPKVKQWWLGISRECWGGEFLPDYLRGEVEIARVEFKNRTRDVVSIRARSRYNVIVYRVLDEHNMHIAFYPRASFESLTLEELILLIDTADYGGQDQGLVRPAIEDEGPPNMSSEYYRHLEPYYRNLVSGRSSLR